MRRLYSALGYGRHCYSVYFSSINLFARPQRDELKVMHFIPLGQRKYLDAQEVLSSSMSFNLNLFSNKLEILRSGNDRK